MARRRITSGSPFELTFGYARAVVDGDRVFSGTRPHHAGRRGAASGRVGQAKRCLEIILAAVGEAGAGAGDVVRTRVFLIDRADFDQVARAHAEVFADVRPGSTAVIVAGLLDPRWLVEIEADEVLGG